VTKTREEGDNMAAEISKNKEVYLFERNEFEKQRLNHQHKLLIKLCHGNILHPSIPTFGVQDVADLGTGSGIWLEDLASTLSAIPSKAPRTYAGFDISASHFPYDEEKGAACSYAIHDILTPFPEAYHGKFDIVHVRLLVLALKKEQIKVAAENAAKLLKPQGYIQWEEFETANLSFTPSSTPAITAVRAALRASTIANGLTNTPSVEIVAALNALSFEDVKVHDYNSVGQEEFTIQAQEWTKGGAQAGLYYALLRVEAGKKKEEEVKDMAEKLLVQFKADIDGGITPTLPLVMVIGRKS